MAELTQRDGLGRIRNKVRAEDITYLKCPKCAASMVRNFYTMAYLVEVDRCDACGLIWFGRDELEMLQEADLPPNLLLGAGGFAPVDGDTGFSPRPLADIEWQAIQQTLHHAAGDKEMAEGKVSPRTRSGEALDMMAPDAFARLIEDECKLTQEVRS